MIIGEAEIALRPNDTGFAAAASTQLGTAGGPAAAALTNSMKPSLLSRMKTLALSAGAVFVTGFAAQKVGQFISGSISEASDIGESLSKVDKLFGDNAESIVRWSRTTDVALGQSQATTLEAVGTYGNLFRAIGLTEGKSADMSRQLVTTASDLASFNNSTPEEALEALRSGLVGETEPLRKFGINMNDTTLKAQALKLGLIDAQEATETLKPDVKAQAAYALILQQSKIAAGDFADTSAGLANQQRIAGAQFSNLQKIIGKALLPVMATLMGFVTGTVLPGLQNLAKSVAPVIKRIGTGLQGLISLLTKGDFTKEFAKAFGVTEDSALVGNILNIRRSVMSFFDDVGSKIKNVDMGKVFAAIGDAIQGLPETLGRLKEAGSPIGPTFRVAGVVIKFLADNIDLFAKALPFLIAGLLAYRVAQAAANVVQAVSPVLRVAEVIATHRLAAANTQLTVALTTSTAAMTGQVAAERASTGAKNAGVFATLRARAAAVAHAVATKAIAAATVIWTGVQAAFNAVMSANPIALVILAIVALVAAIVIAYKNSETFRNVVQAAFEAIKTVVSVVITFIVGVVKRGWAVMQAIFRVVQTVIVPIVKTAFAVIANIVKTYVKVWIAVIKVAWAVIKAVIQTVLRIIVPIIKGAFQVIAAIFRTVWKVVSAVVKTAWGIIKAIISTGVRIVVAVIQKIQAIVDFIRGVFQSVVDAIRDRITTAIDFVREMPGRILGFFTGLAKDMYNAAADFIGGFVNGIREKAGEIISAIKEFITDKLPGWVTGPLGIDSPSKVMMEIGRDVSRGMAIGITQSAPDVERSARSLTDRARVIANDDLGTMGNLGVRARAVAVASGVARPPLLPAGGANPEGITIYEDIKLYGVDETTAAHRISEATAFKLRTGARGPVKRFRRSEEREAS